MKKDIKKLRKWLPILHTCFQWCSGKFAAGGTLGGPLSLPSPPLSSLPSLPSLPFPYK